VAVPGAMEAGLAAWLFWGTLAASLALAFVVALPVNRFMIGRGLGHAVVHGQHVDHRSASGGHGDSHGDRQGDPHDHHHGP
jgi:hypothetical protein